MGIKVRLHLSRHTQFPHHGLFMLLRRINSFTVSKQIQILHERNCGFVPNFNIDRFSVTSSYQSASSWICGTGKFTHASVSWLGFNIHLDTDSTFGSIFKGSDFRHDQICHFNEPTCLVAINALAPKGHALTSNNFVFRHCLPTSMSMCVTFHSNADYSSVQIFSFSAYSSTSNSKTALTALITVVARTVVILSLSVQEVEFCVSSLIPFVSGGALALGDNNSFSYFLCVLKLQKTLHMPITANSSLLHELANRCIQILWN